MSKTVTKENVSLYTESFGEPQNPAILLIMGAASSLLWWEIPFCELLVEKGFYVIRYDNRDTGKSTYYPPGEAGYVFEEMADDAITVLDAYGIDKAVLMGMSLGGMLAQMTALRHPARVRGLVLLAAMYFGEGADQLPSSSDEVNAFFERLAQTPVPEALDELVELTLSQWRTTNQSSRPHDEDHIRAMIRLDIERAGDYASRMNHSLIQMEGQDLERTAEIAAPTLVIHGTEDVVIPYVHGEMLAKTIPDTELLTMEGAGHELNPQDYQVVADKIAQKFH